MLSWSLYLSKICNNDYHFYGRKDSPEVRRPGPLVVVAAVATSVSCDSGICSLRQCPFSFSTASTNHNCDWTSWGGEKQKKKRKTKNKNERKKKKKKRKKITLAFLSPLCGSRAGMRSKTHLFFVYFFERRCLRSLTPTQAPPKMAPHRGLIGANCSQLEERQTTQHAPPPREANWLAMVRQSVASTLSCRPYR